MKQEEKQIVLFFKRGTMIESPQLAAKLNEKFPALLDPIVLPVNEKDLSQPLVIFNRGIFSLTISLTDMSIIYKADKHKEYFNTVVEIIECLEELDYSFERLGYLSTIFHDRKDKEKFVKNMFKENKLIDTDFNLSWYSRELIDSVAVNVWQKEITDPTSQNDLVTVFDINTPKGEAYNISSEFVNSFIKKCDKYIESHDLKA